MARASGSKRPVSTHVETRFLDESGEVVHTANYSEEIEVTDDGVTTHKRSENSALVSGELFNPSMSSGPKPVLMVGTCDFCRNEKPLFPWLRARKTHGLCNVRKLKLCCDCGQPICPRHRHRSRYDSQWRCPRCHKKHRWMFRLKSIFCERVER